MRRRTQKLLLVAAALAVVVAGVAELLPSPGALLRWLGAWQSATSAWVDAHPFAGALGFLAFAALGKVSPFPGGLVVLLSAGFFFGRGVGAVLAALGSALSALLVAVVGRRFLSGPLHRRFGHHLRRVEDDVAQNGFNYLFAARVVPVLPAWLVNLVPVAFDVRLRVVFAATFLGQLPMAIVVANLGATLSDLADAGEVTAGALFRPRVLLPLFALAALVLAPTLWRRWRRR